MFTCVRGCYVAATMDAMLLPPWMLCCCHHDYHTVTKPKPFRGTGSADGKMRTENEHCPFSGVSPVLAEDGGGEAWK